MTTPTPNLGHDLRTAAEWIADHRTHQPMNEAGRLAAALVAAEATHPGNKQAAETYAQQLLQHMPAVKQGLSRAQYAVDLHKLSWRI